MKLRTGLTVAMVIAGLMAAVSCRRTDMKKVTISVPGMSDARSIRIVTNAALDEVVGRVDGIMHDYEVDLAGQVVLYHESGRLLAPEYQRRIVACISQVGFKAVVKSVRLNPPALVQTLDGPAQTWPDRYTAVLAVTGMKDHTDANIVVDAIAYARIGRDDPRVSVNKRAQELVARYESLVVAPKNIEFAIACAGFDANQIPARLGGVDSIPHGWTPVEP